MGERVLLATGPSTGGIRRHVAALAEHLAGAGWRPVLAGPKSVVGPDVAGGDDAGGVVERRQVEVPSGLDPVALWRARSALAAAATDVDLVHAHGLKAGWLASAVPDRPPLVITVHNLVLDEAAGAAAWFLRVLEGRLPRRADRVIAVSDEIAHRFGRPGNVRVIPPLGPRPTAHRDPAAVRSELGIGEADPLITTVARLHPQKDLATFIRAMAEADGIHGAIVGTGPRREELVALARTIGVDDRVHFVGQLDNPADLMAASAMVVVTSLWESGPLALVEAMMMGVPVITTPVGLAPRLVVDGQTGRLVPIGDHAALATAIRTALAEPAAAAAMAARGRRRVEEEMAPDQLAGAVVAVYREALGR